MPSEIRTTGHFLQSLDIKGMVNQQKKAEWIRLKIFITNWVAWLHQATHLDLGKNAFLILQGLNALTPYQNTSLLKWIETTPKMMF